MQECISWWRRDEVCASVPAGEAFTDDGGGRDQVRETLIAAQMIGRRGC